MSKFLHTVWEILVAIWRWFEMPSSRGEQFITWLTIATLGSAILRILGKLVAVVYRVASKAEDVLDWVLALRTAFPDEQSLIDKLKRLNGKSKSHTGDQ